MLYCSDQPFGLTFYPLLVVLNSQNLLYLSCTRERCYRKTLGYLLFFFFLLFSLFLQCVISSVRPLVPKFTELQEHLKDFLWHLPWALCYRLLYLGCFFGQKFLGTTEANVLLGVIRELCFAGNWALCFASIFYVGAYSQPL